MSARPVIRLLAQLDDYGTLSDAAAGTASLRTLGTGATQAAAGNDSRITSAISQATADGLYPALAPATSARNLLTSPGVTVTPLTLKSAAGQDGLDASLLEFKDSSGDVYLRVKGPVTDPMPSMDAGAGGTGRIEFPYMGTGKAPVGISSWNTNFNGTPCPSIAWGYNIEGGGGKVLAGEVLAGWFLESHWNDSGGLGPNVLETYFQVNNADNSVASFRPYYALFDRSGTTREGVLGTNSIYGDPLQFFTCVGNTDVPVLQFTKTPGNRVTVGSIAAAAATDVFLQAPSGQAARLGLGFNSVDAVGLIQTVTADQMWIGFGNSPTREIRMFRAGGSGTLRCAVGVGDAGYSWIVKAGEDGLPVFAARGASETQSAALYRAEFHDGTLLWSIDSGGNMVMGDAKNIVLNTTTGTKLGTATTQKLGFFDATPIVQPAATVALEQVLSNLGLRAAGSAAPLNVGKTIVAPGSGDFGLQIDKIGVGGHAGVQIANQTIGTFNTAWHFFVPSGSSDFVIGRAGFYDVLRFHATNGSITVLDGAHLALGTATGTKIGTATTQKLGLWDKAPVVQPAAIANASGGAIIDIEARAQLNLLLAAMRSFGAIAT